MCEFGDDTGVAGCVGCGDGCYCFCVSDSVGECFLFMSEVMELELV